MRSILYFFPCLVIFLTGLSPVDGKPWPGRGSDFHGYAQYDFEYDGLKGRVVVPKNEARDRPWVWRARFFGHRPEVDVALLKKGFHVAYVDASNLFGSPAAVDRWNRFYSYLTKTHGFHPKPALEGMSRGGLIVYNWASENPGKLSCIYADAPVCDITSWPGGFGQGRGSPGDWAKCKKVYGLTDHEAKPFTDNPIDKLKPLADAGIPLLHVVGDADQVVPVAENTALLEARYKALGGNITVIHKPGVGHRHGLDDPEPIISFILKHTASALQKSPSRCLRKGRIPDRRKQQ
ncbi:hypothetical protein DDZ13_00615 [Coraliomargarita sinensis]|uniref:Uncharacterized protein n=1 Tax=Coraliomargarita sinensis TaxID=2174842 RepID=A0A317ZK59_9BACT|nr:prolyl oligopeptidase family serine peptidase [Coraliomargarita sinensis]PXA05402.1 hypothetical protein DDZ13_00615 [Coraliomargarita sinensis]